MDRSKLINIAIKEYVNSGREVDGEKIDSYVDGFLYGYGFVEKELITEEYLLGNGFNKYVDEFSNPSFIKSFGYISIHISNAFDSWYPSILQVYEFRYIPEQSVSLHDIIFTNELKQIEKLIS